MNTELKETIIRNESFILPTRYVPNKQIGKGAYGVVVSGLDTEKNVSVAIKKNKRVFDQGPLSLHLSMRVLRELKILSHLNHPNIISLRDVIIPQSYDKFTDLYIVNELMETDLRNIL